MKTSLATLLIVGLIATGALAQEAGQRRVIIRRAGPGGPGGPMPGMPMPGGPGPQGDVLFWQGNPAEMAGISGESIGIAGTAKWWKNSELVKKLEVGDDQVQKLEKIFQDHRLQLIDLHANLEKQEAMLEPLIEADQPNESQVLAGIEKVAGARAALEKSNAQMLLAVRRVLTVDQWKKLREQTGAAPFFFSAFSPKTFTLPVPPPEAVPGVPAPMPPR